MAKRRIMREFRIHEISAVTQPAQEGALATIMKVALPADNVAAILKSYSDPADGARSFGQIITDQVKQERYWSMQQEVSPAIYALECSLRSIAGDQKMTAEAKQVAARTSIEEFLSLVQDQWPELKDVLDEGMNDVIKVFKQGEGDMTKTAAELQKDIEALTEKLAAAETTAAGAKDLEKQIGGLKSQIETLTKSAEADKVAKDELEAKAAMSDADKAYLAGLKEDEAKKAFLKMSADERKKVIAKAADSDETLEIAGRTIRKSVVGDDTFAVMKAQQASIKQTADDMAKANDRAETAEFTKVADETLKHLPGKTEEKVDVLKALKAMPEAARKTLDAMLAAGNKAISAAYDKLGHAQGEVPVDTKQATSKFKERVDVMVKGGLSRTDAMSKAREQYPDEYKAAYPDRADHEERANAHRAGAH